MWGMEMSEFKITVNGEEKTVLIKKPNSQVLADAKLEANKTVSRAIRAGELSRNEIRNYMRNQGMWDDEKENRLDELQLKIRNGERALAKGGIKLEEARKLALDIRGYRAEFSGLLVAQRELDQYSAQGQGDNVQFDYLVSACAFYEDGKQVFESLDDYRNRADEEIAERVAAEFSLLHYGLNPDFQKNRPENKFLLKYGFVNEDLHLIDKKGRMVDMDGRLVDKDGKFIDEDGNFVDIYGNQVDKDGNVVEDFVPFIE